MLKRTFAGKDKVNMTVGYRGNKVFYTVKGDGPACILLHGFLENSSIWKTFSLQLEKNYNVICIDLPGHGKSDISKELVSIEGMAMAVQEVVKAEKLDRMHIVGHSMGGYVGLSLAHLHPESISQLILLNSTPQADTELRVANRKHGIAVAKKNYEAIVKMSISNLFAEQNRKKLRVEIDALKQEALKTPLEGYINAQIAMMNRDDLSTFWKNATFRKCMILGKDDILIDAEEQKKEFESSVNNMAILAGGHMLFLENAAKTYTTIQDFLDAGNKNPLH
ncbi:MAG: alpha/beta hydrolase [Leeuwenhoekiella sp.]